MKAGAGCVTRACVRAIFFAERGVPFGIQIVLFYSERSSALGEQLSLEDFQACAGRRDGSWLPARTSIEKRRRDGFLHEKSSHTPGNAERCNLRCGRGGIRFPRSRHARACSILRYLPPRQREWCSRRLPRRSFGSADVPRWKCSVDVRRPVCRRHHRSGRRARVPGVFGSCVAKRQPGHAPNAFNAVLRCLRGSAHNASGVV